MHRHHIIPRHSGGADTEENLTPPISVALHAEFHRWLWLDGGKIEDFIAWQALLGRLTSEEARLAAAKHAQTQSVRYRSSRTNAAAFMQRGRTQESCSRGGRTASISLLRWQSENADIFRANCAANGRKSGLKQNIPHSHNGIVYPSKKALQKALKISICGFYGKLKRGEIERLDFIR